MTMLLLWVYMLGPWTVGPFTDKESCEELRQYQINEGVSNIGTCEFRTIVVTSPTSAD